ncbi:MAG: hypothetical protein ACJ8F7_12780, partial [Gemmataceae bacterium]
MLPAPSPVAGPTAPPAPLRVVHLVWTLDDGGQGNVVFDLARMLNPERFDVRVLCLGGVGTLGPRFQAANVPVESLAVVGKSSLGAFRRVWRRLREL